MTLRCKMLHWFRHEAPDGLEQPHGPGRNLHPVRQWTMYGMDPRELPMSKAQLNAFMAKVAGDAALKARVDAAEDSAAVVAIASGEGHSFSAATWSRHIRG